MSLQRTAYYLCLLANGATHSAEDVRVQGQRKRPITDASNNREPNKAQTVSIKTLCCALDGSVASIAICPHIDH